MVPLPHIRSHRVPCSCFPKKVSLQLSSEQCIGCQDYAAELEERSTGKVPRLQKFSLHNCWVFVAPRKWKHQLTPESAECCRTRDGSRQPSREVPARTATGKPGMLLWTWRTLGWEANGVRVILARCDRGISTNVWLILALQNQYFPQDWGVWQWIKRGVRGLSVTMTLLDG